MPMIVGKHERTLAIDGPYIHVRIPFLLLPRSLGRPIFVCCMFVVVCVQIMPTTNKGAKAVFDSGKTSSYHINSVVSCQSGKTSSAAFRIVVHRVSRDGGNKRYEFEAENAKLASASRSFIHPSTLPYICIRTVDEIVQTIKGLKSVLERSDSISSKARRGKPP